MQEPQCTNLGALRLFACPCVVLMSRSLLRGTASTAVPTKTANLFAGWHTWARPPFGEKPGGRKLDFTDLMDEFLGWHGRWLGATGWRSCRERVVEFSATSPRWPFDWFAVLHTNVLFRDAFRWCYEPLCSNDSNGVFFFWKNSQICLVLYFHCMLHLADFELISIFGASNRWNVERLKRCNSVHLVYRLYSTSQIDR